MKRGEKKKKEVKEKKQYFCECGREIFPGKLLAMSRRKEFLTPEYYQVIAEHRWERHNRLKANRAKPENQEIVKKYIEHGGF